MPQMSGKSYWGFFHGEGKGLSHHYPYLLRSHEGSVLFVKCSLNEMPNAQKSNFIFQGNGRVHVTQ